MVRRHYYVSGRVQGVGFRYRAFCAAQHLRLTGYAVNLYDGRVEMEVQGDRNLIDLFFDEICHGSFIRIDDLEEKDMPVQPDENHFRID